MKTNHRKYKIDELEHAQKQLNELRQSGNATPQQLQQAQDERDRQQDIYSCSIGTDY